MGQSIKVAETTTPEPTQDKKEIAPPTPETANLILKPSFIRLDYIHGWPEGTIQSLKHQESPGAKSQEVTSNKGAKGYFQFMPATRADTLKKSGYDAWSPDINIAAKAAAYHLNAQVKKFDGDLVKGLSSYNTGEGNMGKALRKWGDNWLPHLSKETRKFAKEILARVGLDYRDDINANDIKAERQAEQLAIAERKKALQEMATQPLEANSTLTDLSTSLVSALENMKHKIASSDFLGHTLEATASGEAKGSQEGAIARFAEWFKSQVTSPAPVVSEANHNTIEVPKVPAKQAASTAVIIGPKS